MGKLMGYYNGNDPEDLEDEDDDEYEFGDEGSWGE